MPWFLYFALYIGTVFTLYLILWYSFFSQGSPPLFAFSFCIWSAAIWWYPVVLFVHIKENLACSWSVYLDTMGRDRNEVNPFSKCYCPTLKQFCEGTFCLVGGSFMFLYVYPNWVNNTSAELLTIDLQVFAFSDPKWFAFVYGFFPANYK